MDINAVIRNFQSRGFQAVYFDTEQQAKKYLIEQCTGKSVSFGGSMTLEHMGLYEALKPCCPEVNWHWKGDGYCQTPDIYLTSANAVSQTGEIVNIDGMGNRVAATLYGTDEVIFVCGINKIRETLSAAIERAQNIAAPQNACRLEKNTACTAAGKQKCFHCKPSHSICRAMVIHQAPMLHQKRCELVLIGESLGY